MKELRLARLEENPGGLSEEDRSCAPCNYRALTHRIGGLILR